MDNVQRGELNFKPVSWFSSGGDMIQSFLFDVKRGRNMDNFNARDVECQT